MELSVQEKEVVNIAVYLHFKSLTNETSYAFEELPENLDEAIVQYKKEFTDSSTDNKTSIEDLLKVGEAEIKDKKLLKHLCPFLVSTSKDIQEYAKVTYTVLLPLIISKVIVLSLNPLLIAAISVVLFKGGVDSLCSKYSKKQENE